MLVGLGLKDWKSFGDLPAVPFNRVSLLVGPNASGKSNLIDALRFLQGCALGMSAADALRGRYEGQREVWPGVRGGAREASRNDRGEFTLIAHIADSPARPELLLNVRVGTLAEPLFRAELLTDRNDSKNFWYRSGSTRGSSAEGVSMDIVEIRGTDTKYPGDPQLLSLGRLPESNGNSQDAHARAHHVHTVLRELIFLDVQPHRMRDYRPDGGWHLGINAENISPVLYLLGQEQPARLADVVDWLSELCGPTIESIDFDRTRLGETMLFLVERGGAKISARSASDGTLRFLGLVAALLTVPEGSTLIMEEPDVGLHPSRLHLLASLFEDTAKARNLQIIATTHSPTLLAHLSPNALGDVLAFGRDPETGCTVAKRVGDLPHFATLRDAKDLEHLISNGWLERAL